MWCIFKGIVWGKFCGYIFTEVGWGKFSMNYLHNKYDAVDCLTMS